MGFEYNGINSEEFSLIIGSVDHDNDDYVGIKRDIDMGEMNKYRHHINIYGIKYSEPLIFNINIIKDPCIASSKNDLYFSKYEIIDINKWLMSNTIAEQLTIDRGIEPYDKDINYYGVFTEYTPKSIDGHIVSLKYTFMSNSPFGFTNDKSVFINANGSVLISTDNNGEPYIYPTLKITGVESGNITLTNETENKSLTMKALKDYDIYIDSNKLKIYDKLGVRTISDLGITDIGDLYWFRLLDGDNKIKLTGNAKVTITYKEIRKVGDYT